MGFWIFMLIMVLLIPVTMLGFGKLFLNKPPKDINCVFGYRTTMSMKNKDTWEFAHKYCGRIWYICGWIMVPLSVIAMLFVTGEDYNMIGMVGGIICFVQLIPLIVVVVPTERALRRVFDGDGKRKTTVTNIA